MAFLFNTKKVSTPQPPMNIPCLVGSIPTAFKLTIKILCNQNRSRYSPGYLLNMSILSGGRPGSVQSPNLWVLYLKTDIL